jgi:hypothetical protein
MTLLGFILLALPALLQAQNVTDKIIISWYKSNGTNWNISSMVQHVYYNGSYVWINVNSIPSYTIGPWSGISYVPKKLDTKWFFYRTPSVQSGTKTLTGMGAMGLWLDGVYIFNSYNGYTYNSKGVWKVNAYFNEGSTWDKCNGHPSSYGEYHTHGDPTCLYTKNSASHSPLLGYIFDSYPIYGPFGYSSANDSKSSIKRMLSSYSPRNIVNRTSLANGTALNSTLYGPPVNSTYPIGYYQQDYEYIAGQGDLDMYNGRWCVTPEYPNGTYAYFVTTNSSGVMTYPYTVGPAYYGKMLWQSRVSVPSRVTTYF